MGYGANGGRAVAALERAHPEDDTARMRKVRLVVVLGLLSCDGEDSPVEKCEAFRTPFCSRLVSCKGGMQASCEQTISTVIDCGRAAGVGASYDQCMQDVGSFTCDTLLFPASGSALPASCSKVILVRQ